MRRKSRQGPTRHQCYFRMGLKQQFCQQSSYLIDGQLRQSVALAACPAQHGVSAVMTFIINRRGVVYQKYLGEGQKVAD